MFAQPFSAGEELNRRGGKEGGGWRYISLRYCPKMFTSDNGLAEKKKKNSRERPRKAVEKKKETTERNSEVIYQSWARERERERERLVGESCIYFACYEHRRLVIASARDRAKWTLRNDRFDQPCRSRETSEEIAGLSRSLIIRGSPMYIYIHILDGIPLIERRRLAGVKGWSRERRGKDVLAGGTRAWNRSNLRKASLRREFGEIHVSR